jgi:hypothetical protein
MDIPLIVGFVAAIALLLALAACVLRSSKRRAHCIAICRLLGPTCEEEESMPKQPKNSLTDPATVQPSAVAMHVNKLVRCAPWETRRLKAIVDDFGVVNVERWLLAASTYSGRQEPADLWIQQLKMIRPDKQQHTDPIVSTPRGSVVPEGSFVSPCRGDMDNVLTLRGCHVPLSMVTSPSASLDPCDAACAAFDALVCAAMHSLAHPELELFMLQFRKEQYVRLVLRPIAEHDATESVASGSGGDLSKQETVCYDECDMPPSLLHCEHSWESHDAEGSQCAYETEHGGKEAVLSGSDRDLSRMTRASAANSDKVDDDAELWPLHIVQGLDRQRSWIPASPAGSGSVQLSLRRNHDSMGKDSFFSLAIAPIDAPDTEAASELYETLTAAAVV